MTTELRDLLELASEDVVEVDLAERAWQVARRERAAVRRRVVLGAGGLAAAGALVTVLANRDDRPASPAGRSAAPTPSPGLDGSLDEQLVGPLRVSMAPAADAERLLPTYPDAGVIAVPDVVGPREAGSWMVLEPGAFPGTAASVRAVFLVHTVGGYWPVVHVPRAEKAQYLLASRMTLEAIHDSVGTDGPVLGSRTVDDERHRVVVAQPRKVVVLDVRDGSVLELPVPDSGLLHAGWAKDGRTVVARSSSQDWLVDTQTHRVLRAPDPARPDWEDVAAGPEGRTTLRSFAGSGTLSGSRVVPDTLVVPYGESTANTEAWVASGAFLDDALTRRLGRYQGVIAVQDDLSITPRVLAAPEGPTTPKAAYRPLGWGPRDTLLLESRSYPVTGAPATVRILAWDVIGARLWRVAEVQDAEPGQGGFSGIYAL
jgi:hypothetical protein